MKKLCTLVLSLGLLLTLLVAPDAEAQRWTKRKQYATVGFTLGAMNYFGDIVPQPDFTSFRFKSTRPSASISYSYRFAPRFSYRAGLTWGRITGDDALSASSNESENRGRYGRNLSFRNDIKELSIVGIVDLYENRSTFQRRPDFVPYGFLGVAVMHHNPKAYYDGNFYHSNLVEQDKVSSQKLDPAYDIPSGWYELQPLGTEGQYLEGDHPKPYKRAQIVVPFGLGVRYKIDRYWDLSLEIGWRKTFTDYLDDVSESYVSKAALLGDGSTEAQRAAAIFADRSVASGYVNNPPFQEDSSGSPYQVIRGYGDPGRQRGDKEDNDWYITTGITINYILTPRIRSPKFR